MALPSPGEFVAFLAFSVVLSLLVFSHASRHGDRHATAWGVVAFLFGLVGAAVYFTRYWRRHRTRRY